MINIPSEIRALFRNGGVLKNIRIHFPNGEREDITSANVVEESFSFTESLCSQNLLQFGLCEASVVQFETFGVENIKGYAIEVFHEIDISSLGTDFIAEYGMTSEDVSFPFYRIPYGKFTVDECLKQADMTKRKVVAYGEMLENIKPNDFELAKGNIQFEKNGNYTIDVFKYLYSNVSVNTEIPSATLTEISSISSYVTMITGTEYSILTEASQGSVKGTELVKISLGEIVNTFENGFAEMLRYVQDNIPEIYSNLEIFKKFYERNLSDYVSWMDFDYINNTDYYFRLDKNQYLYNGLPYVTTYIAIPRYFALVDTNMNVLKKIDLKGGGTKIERVDIDAPQTTVSYPLKKSKDGYYYIKDIPYDDMGEPIEAAFELHGKFGKVDRYGNFAAVDLCQRKKLYPSDKLYPGGNIYPGEENSGCIYENEYMSAWYADEYTKLYDKVCVTYTNTDGEEEYLSQMLVDTEAEAYNKDDYQTYSLTDNYIIRNSRFSSEDIERILTTVAEAIKDVRYMPSDITLSGRPDLEAGDMVRISIPEGTFETVILRRTLTGIQCIIDNFESKG